MGAYESSYKSQLQGVSQQIARERLDGQVTAQENMLSDAVSNLRRRPGAGFTYSIAFPGATEDRLVAWPAELSGQRVQVLLNTVDGTVKVLDTAYAVLATLVSSYLITTSPDTIQAGRARSLRIRSQARRYTRPAPSHRRLRRPATSPWG